MRLLDDEGDEDDDSFEVESEDEGGDDEQDSIQRHPVKKNSEAAFNGVDKRSQMDGDENSEGEFTLKEGHDTIKRLQDDLFAADEDEPDDGMFSY